MTDEHTQHPSSRGKSRRERVEHARSRDIFDVTNELNMELVRSGRDYRWKEHDSMVISPEKNMWNWFSRHQGGDVIALVQTIKEINFNQAIDYLNDGTFKKFTAVERVQEHFSYYLEPYEKPFEAARNYLKDQRRLSDEMIDFFLDKGVLAQADAKINGSIEPVVVFKSFGFSGEIVGATLQGIEENWEKWPERGYAKNIVRNSDGITGMHVDIGQPNRLVFAESNIDLMSYYELHQDKLQDVRLVSMDGLKEAVVGRHLTQLQSDISGRPLRWDHDQLAEGLQTAIDNNFFKDGKHANWITLAVDNDVAGRNFINSLREKGAVVTEELPELQPGQEKTDWNDYLKQVKERTVQKETEQVSTFPLDVDAIQETLSQEGDLIKTFVSENQMRYTNRVDMPQGYQLNLVIYSPEEVENLSEVAANWTLEVARDNQSLGYLAYGSDWGNEFQVKEEVQHLREWLQTNQLEYQLYSQKEINSFLQQYDEVVKIDNSRLSQAQRKLERLKNEFEDETNAVYEHASQTNGQPMNDKRGGDRYFKRQEQLENKVFGKLDEIKQQEERVDRLEHQQHLKELGLNRRGTGLEMSVENIPRIREELELAARGESFYTKATIRRYRKELERLEGISEQVSNVAISPLAQSLIDDGSVNQWAKQPNTYFVKGLRRVALELTESGEFQVSAKYSPSTPEEETRVAELLTSQELTEHLSTIARNQLPDNIQASEEIQELLGQIEYLGQIAYFWVTEEDLEQPREIISRLDDWFSSGKVDETYTSEHFEVIVGDYTYMIEFKDANISLQNMEEYAKYISERIEDLGIDVATSELETVMADFNQVKQSITDGMTKEIEFVVNDRNQPEETLQSQKEKSLDMIQETNTGGELLNRNSSFLGEESPGTAPQPVEQPAQPDFPANVHLHFTTDEGNMSNKSFRKNLRTLNLYSNTIRDSAQWYLTEMSGTTMSYVYKTPQDERFQILNVHFDKKNWMHLTGVIPGYDSWVESLSEQFIEDVARGNGHFRDLKFAPGTADKLKVLNLLPEIIESDTFVFNDLSSVQKFHNLDLSKALNPEDTDLLLLFKGEGEYQVPASLMRIKGEVAGQLSNIDNGTVLGVYREKDGKLEQISINEEYVKDGGEELFSVLKNKQYQDFSSEQPITPEPSQDEGVKWMIEINETTDGIIQIPSFEGQEVNQELLRTIKDCDERLNIASLAGEGQGYYKFYFDKIQNGEVIDNLRVDVGDGLDVNQKLYDLIEQDLNLADNKEPEIQKIEVSSEAFTGVLDAVYNNGAPQDLSNVPEEFHAAWNRYFEIHKASQGDFKQVINQAVQDNLLVTESLFYKEWTQDRIYNENYHVRLQWAETSPDGPQIPFKETELIDYQTFAEVLYEQNKAFYERHQESVTGNQDDYIPFTKVKFDVYAPGGRQIKDNVTYDVGYETEPISRLLGLGYRRLEGQTELAAIDETVLSQLENQEMNQEIATEANEQNLNTQELIPEEDSSSRGSFRSPNQEMKAGLTQRIEEIMAEDTVSNQVKERNQEPKVSKSSTEPFDYTSASAYEISERAFQKIREYTQSPEELMEYMDFLSKFPKLSPRNVALIHDQWRGANAVATYDQWQAMGEALGIKPEDVIQTKATYINKRTGETKEVVHQGLSVKTGEKSQITLFRPLMVKMIPVLDANGNQVKNDKSNPKYKKLSEATAKEKALVKEGKLPVRQFQERDRKTDQPRFTTYKVFELSQTTIKPESYPKAMPNRHYNFNMDKVKTKEVLEGLCDYAESISITMMKDEAHVLGNAKGAFFPEEQLILINPDNTPGEKIATTIHELAHATLHNPKLVDQYKENIPKTQKELEAEMTSHLLSKHFGLDTSEKAIDYMAKWTNNLKELDDNQLANSLKRVHKTVSKMLKQVENHTKPYQLGKSRGQAPNFPKATTKGPSH